MKTYKDENGETIVELTLGNRELLLLVAVAVAVLAATVMILRLS